MRFREKNPQQIKKKNHPKLTKSKLRYRKKWVFCISTNRKSSRGSEIQIKFHDGEYWINEGKGETCDVLNSMVVNVLWHRRSVFTAAVLHCVCVLCGLLVCVTLVNILFLMELPSLSQYYYLLCYAVHTSRYAGVDICFTCMCVYNCTAGTFFFFKAVYFMLFLLCKDPCYSDQAKTIGCSSIQR